MKRPTVRWNFVSIPGSRAPALFILMTATPSGYQHGEFLRQTFTCQSDGNSVRVNFGARQGTYSPWWKTMEVVVYDWPSAQADARLSNGTSPVSTSYDAATHALHVVIPDIAGETDLRIGSGPVH